MPKVQLRTFDGAEPRASPHLLADSRAQIASNSKLHTGALEPYLGPSPILQTVPLGAASIYPLRRNADVRWLSWPEFTVVTRGTLPDVNRSRIYFASDTSGLRYTDWDLASPGFGPYPAASVSVALPAPVSPPSLSVVSGPALNAETRVYVLTYVRTLGGVEQETGPSPPAQVEIVAGQTARVSSVDAAPPFVETIRVYRSIPVTFGVQFAFVGEFPPGGSLVDNRVPGTFGPLLETQSYQPPPDGLRWPVAHPSGALAGFVGNTLYFSEPYRLHAWPIDYAVTIPFNIVALGTYGNSIVVLTDTAPYIVTGDVPGQMVVDVLSLSEPCVSQASVSSFDGGVLYASHNGLVLIGPGRQGVISETLYRKDEWRKLNPSSMVATVHNNRYYASHAGENPGTIVVDPIDRPSLVTLDAQMTAIRSDTASGELFYTEPNSSQVLQLDSDDLRPLPYRWKSKRFQMPQAASWAAYTLEADFTDNAFENAFNNQIADKIAINQARFAAGLAGGAINRFTLNHQETLGETSVGVTVNGSLLYDIQSPATIREARVTVFADGKQVYSEPVTDSRPRRLPSVKCREVELQISGTVRVTSLTVATTVEELWG